MRHRGWAAEHPKRYLSASLAVGTVDQCLLSALMTDHAHLRATTLLRSLLVVDEVHASDAYMTTLLREVLRFHRASGGHALLMSATLGSTARDLFLRGTPCTPYAVARGEAYPRITYDAPHAAHTPRRLDAGRSKTVHVETHDALDEPVRVARLAADAAAQGARVLVLRNTVSACVETLLALEAIADPAVLFRVRGYSVPHHARYARADREALDLALSAQLGKNSPGGPRAVVATQTVQQSLDLDADLLLTDLCPMDVLLQRIGRLHRHERARPRGFETARCVVLRPPQALRDLLGRDGKARGRHGFGMVYEDLRVLVATLGMITARPTWRLPEHNRELVEAATHPEALRTAVPDDDALWHLHARSVLAGVLVERQLARSNVVDREVRFGEQVFGELQARTRLGAYDRIAELPEPCQTPLGSRVSRLNVPAWMARGVDEETTVDELTRAPEGFAFRFGERRYCYDRLGLRLDAPSDTSTEDDA
jgi:CRISPR-associated endonuclease/helicase Cas3